MNGAALPEPDRRQPWGPFLTVLLGAAVFVSYVSAQGAALIPLAVMQAMHGVSTARITEFMLTGFSLSLAMVVSCPVMVLGCGVLAWARRSLGVAEYLAVKAIPVRSVLGWCGLQLAVGLLIAGLNAAFGRESPEFVTQLYSTAVYLPLLWTAVGVAAPLAEEVLLRGFLFSGLSRSRLGVFGTIILTSLVFTLMHLGQYDAVDLSQVWLIGVFLGVGRAVSGSILAPLAMHVVHNCVSLAAFSMGH